MIAGSAMAAPSAAGQRAARIVRARRAAEAHARPVRALDAL
jgi:hypothetical protein